MLHLILMVFAFVFAVLAMVGVPEHPRFHYIGAALAFYFLALLLTNTVVR